MTLRRDMQERELGYTVELVTIHDLLCSSFAVNGFADHLLYGRKHYCPRQPLLHIAYRTNTHGRDGVR